ncbi:hypothetical protein [Aquibium sp. ELW1220]|uniref:hypothetical protein n=1 Tax=Aquibium sp. ELW1220 TaxID=2976766 RepID=UPI0025B07CF9|nr:hypothetical protein [Aquibium sp. ELW1220]MDN2578731.1 hypothetical protein [Aquibium sp. ELW1220]
MTADGSSTLLSWKLSEVIGLMRSAASRRDDYEWLNLFRLRYLDLDASELQWQEFNRKMPP